MLLHPIGRAANSPQQPCRIKIDKDWKDIVKYFLALVLVALVSLAGSALAQGRDSHIVRVIVDPVNAVDVSDAAVTLHATAPSAGNDFTAVTDATSILYWTTNAAQRKIVVSTGGAQPMYDLSVEAKSETAGDSVGPVAISGTEMNLIINAGKTFGEAILEYSITPTVADAPSSAAYNVFYTLTVQ